jgi:Tfp pilus assembly protein PilF
MKSYITISHFECKGPHVNESYSLLQAVDILEQLIDLVPGLVDAHLMLAWVLFRMNKSEAAQQSIQSALALDFGSSKAHLLLAQVNGSIVFLPKKRII